MSEAGRRRERDYLKRLLSSSVTATELKDMLADRRALSFHAVRRALAGHPKTPRSDALSLIPTLFWRDLAAVSADARAHPEVRRAADREILRRLPEMALSERVDLARVVGRGVIAVLRFDPEPRVIESLLSNRLLVEADVVAAAANPRALAGALRVIGSEARWTLRQDVRSALVRNPRTPLALALAFLSTIPLPDLQLVVESPALAPLLRQCAIRVIERRSAVDETDDGT